MRTLYYIMILLLLGSCTSTEDELLKDPRFAGGLDLFTRYHIKPRFFRFGSDHLFVTGADSSNQATLGYYYQGKELYTQNLEEGVFDTIFAINLNGDKLPDFVVHCCFNEDCVLNALVCDSAGNLRSATNIEDLGSNKDEKPLLIEEHGGLLVRDINGDGLDDLVLHTNSQGENTLITRQTHTILAQQILADLNGSD